MKKVKKIGLYIGTLLLLILTFIFLCFIAFKTWSHNHEFSEWTILTEATCTQVGQRVRVCECGEKELEEIPVTLHNYTIVVTQPTCTEQGFSTYTCDCGNSCVDNYVDALGHSLDVVRENEVAATCTNAGSYEEVVYCSVCIDNEA